MEDMCLESTASERESSSGEGENNGSRPVTKRRLSKQTQALLDNDSFYGAEMPGYLRNREFRLSLGSARFIVLVPVTPEFAASRSKRLLMACCGPNDVVLKYSCRKSNGKRNGAFRTIK